MSTIHVIPRFEAGEPEGERPNAVFDALVELDHAVTRLEQIGQEKAAAWEGKAEVIAGYSVVRTGSAVAIRDMERRLERFRRQVVSSGRQIQNVKSTNNAAG